MKRKLGLGLFLLLLTFSIAAQSGRSYGADRFDVEVDVRPDGSLLVEENVTFRFAGGPFTYVFRELPTDHTDGLTVVSAGVDGTVWPQGNGPGQVEISGNDPIVVTWHLPPTADTAQTFTLTYEALGVAARGETADRLDWQALPDEYEYTIGASEVRFNFPSSAQLSGPPEVLTSGGPDWRIEQTPSSVTFSAADLSPEDPLVTRLSFVPGTLFTTTPQWQLRQEAQNSRAWIWFALGALVAAGGLLLAFRAAGPYLRSVPKASTHVYKPPFDLPPAHAGYLANPTVSWNLALATLFDLAGRGYVEIEQTADKSLLRSAQFEATLLKELPNPRPHEQALIDLLFTDKHGNPYDVVALSDIGKRVTTSRWKKFTETLDEEMEREGYIDEAAKKRQKRFYIWGVLLMLAVIPLMIAGFLLDEQFGMWPLVTIAFVGVLGFITVMIGVALSLLSDKGHRYAAAFEPFRKMLKDTAKGKATLPDSSYYLAYLPYATAYGVAESWVKDQSKKGYDTLPPYFRAAQASGAEMAAFIAVISAASNSGGAAAATGAAGAGAAAAGGGASGAG